MQSHAIGMPDALRHTRAKGRTRHFVGTSVPVGTLRGRATAPDSATELTESLPRRPA